MSARSGMFWQAGLMWIGMIVFWDC